MFRIARTVALSLTLLPLAVPASSDDLPSWLIRIPASVKTVFVAETGQSLLHRFEHADGTLKRVESIAMSIGRNGAGKERRGDRRTPIGAYFVTEQLDTSRLHEKYGVTAFPLDYPNGWDRRHARSGDGIWIHGVDPDGGERPDRDTDGCIALPNADLERLVERFEFGRTPVVVGRNAGQLDDQERHRLERAIAGATANWSASIAAGDAYAYLSYYHDAFERWSLNRAEWASLALQTLFKRPISATTVEDLLIIAYPGEENLYLSRFRHRLTEAGQTREQTVRLYWRETAAGEFRIVGEDVG